MNAMTRATINKLARMTDHQAACAKTKAEQIAEEYGWSYTDALENVVADYVWNRDGTGVVKVTVPTNEPNRRPR